MNLEKGKIYEIYNPVPHFMANNLAEYHSTFKVSNTCAGHNMVIRLRSGELEIGVFMDNQIRRQSEIKKV